MAYVPGFDSDLFLSYAQSDSHEWITALEESLTRELASRLGEALIWRDKKNIRFGQDWSQEIDRAVRSAASLLAVVTPHYRRSEWCDIERNTFVNGCEATKSMRAGRYNRFLKVIKTPWPDNLHEQFYPSIQHINFFESRPTDDPIPDTVEFAPHTEAFRQRVAQAAQAIASLLEQMRRSRQAIFLAGVTGDCVRLRNQLRTELRAHGYDAGPDGNPDQGFADEYVRSELKRALVSIHLLGGWYAPWVERQVELARDAGKPLLFWLTRHAEQAEGAQRTLVDAVRDAGHEWLAGSAPEAIALIVAAKLEPAITLPSAFGTATRKVARIYLLCDVTTSPDAEFAARVQKEIQDVEGMDVALPAQMQPVLHEGLLREADGLLLYRNVAPERWLYRTTEHVIHAERISQRSFACTSKGLLLADPNAIPEAPLPVYLPSTPFRLSDIEQFLAPLRRKMNDAA